MININKLSYKRICLLQGPMGPFFYKLAKYLKSRNNQVYKINFNDRNSKHQAWIISYEWKYAFTYKINEWRSHEHALCMQLIKFIKGCKRTNGSSRISSYLKEALRN